MLVERGLHFKVCCTEFRIAWPEASVEDPVKRLRLVQAPFRAGEYAGQGEERLVPRSSRWPMAREKCDSSHLTHRRNERIGIDVCRCAIETFFEADRFTGFVDARRHYSVQAD